jgi:hypothetical protein
MGEKLKLICEADEVGNHATGRKYDIPGSCIRDWIIKKGE